jgi:hypothetical protein
MMKKKKAKLKHPKKSSQKQVVLRLQRGNCTTAQCMCLLTQRDCCYYYHGMALLTRDVGDSCKRVVDRRCVKKGHVLICETHPEEYKLTNPNAQCVKCYEKEEREFQIQRLLKAQVSIPC